MARSQGPDYENTSLMLAKLQGGCFEKLSDALEA